jgi:hypothetical protein
LISCKLNFVIWDTYPGLALEAPSEAEEVNLVLDVLFGHRGEATLSKGSWGAADLGCRHDRREGARQPGYGQLGTTLQRSCSRGFPSRRFGYDGGVWQAAH